MIAYIHCSVLGISGHRCGPSLSPSSGLDVKRCPGSSSFSLVRTWSPVLIHVQGRLWCKVKEKGGPREKERERVSELLSSCLRSLLAVSSSHLCMLTAIWSYYLSRFDRFMCDVLYAHWAFCVEWREHVQSQNWHQVKRQNGRRGGVQVLMGDKYCRVDGKQLKEWRRHLFCYFINSDFSRKWSARMKEH